MASAEAPFGCSVADVQPGNTNEYVAGMVETYRELGLIPQVVAGGNLATGNAAEVNLASVEAAQ